MIIKGTNALLQAAENLHARGEITTAQLATMRARHNTQPQHLQKDTVIL